MMSKKDATILAAALTEKSASQEDAESINKAWRRSRVKKTMNRSPVGTTILHDKLVNILRECHVMDLRHLFERAQIPVPRASPEIVPPRKLCLRLPKMVLRRLT